MANNLQVQVYRDGKLIKKIDREDYGIAGDFDRAAKNELLHVGNVPGTKSTILLMDTKGKKTVKNITIQSVK